MSSRYPTVAVLPGTGPESDKEGGSVSSRGSGLRQVKKAADLADFIEEVHDGWNHAKGSMVAQFTKRLYRLGYTKEATDSYLQSGVLPRLVADTHAGYSRLLRDTRNPGFVFNLGLKEERSGPHACVRASRLMNQLSAPIPSNLELKQTSRWSSMNESQR